MLNCVPQEIAVTADYLLGLTKEGWNRLFQGRRRVYIHWQTLLSKIHDVWISNDYIQRIIGLWEDNKLVPIPNSDNIAELPAIASLNYIYPDNVKVYCKTFGEYVELRKNFGREDIGGF